MIHGETVKVLRPSIAGMDAYNTPIRKWSEESVGNVLVARRHRTMSPQASIRKDCLFPCRSTSRVHIKERSGIARWSSVESNIE